MRIPASLLAPALLILAMTGQALAATAIVKDGGTLQLAGNIFRLDGIERANLRSKLLGPLDDSG